MLSSSGQRGRRGAPPVATQPATAPAPLDPEYRQWQCAMEAHRELQRQYARARKTSNRRLIVMLGGQLRALALRCDLLLASAVAASRGWAPEPPARTRGGIGSGSAGPARNVGEGDHANAPQVRRATQ